MKPEGLLNELPGTLECQCDDEGRFMKFFELELPSFYLDFYAHGIAKMMQYAGSFDSPSSCEIEPVDINITGIKLHDKEGSYISLTATQDIQLTIELLKLIEVR